MKKYYIIGNGSSYLTTIYTNSISTSSHDNDAFRARDIEEATALCIIANRLTTSSSTFNIYCVETTISKIDVEA